MVCFNFIFYLQELDLIYLYCYSLIFSAFVAVLDVVEFFMKLINEQEESGGEIERKIIWHNLCLVHSL